MIGQIITGKDGKPDAQVYKKLAKSAYQPQGDVKKLWQQCQNDYQIAYMLQHRPFREFDGVSLLDRARLDQETFAAYVGAEWIPEHKRWKWKGRKNTARNKLINICATMLSGMLYPYVNAHNELNEEDKMTARVMRIRIEDHLKKADYGVKFLFTIMSALVNPAVFVQIEWVEMMQKIKSDGKIEEVLNEYLSGLVLNILPIDEVMLPDFYSGTGDLRKLNCITRIRRIPWDEARAKWAGKYFTTTPEGQKDLFDYCEAGKTRIFLTGQEHQQLYDIEWTEADAGYIQEATFYYQYEDLEVASVGGVLMVNENDVYNNNPFGHRRFTLNADGWKSFPVLPIAMSGFEPLDPAGRFAYYKSGAFKEFWDDKGFNKMSQLMHDSVHLDVIKPTIISGVTKVDGTMMVPGGVFGVPAGSNVTQYGLTPNIQAAFQAIQQYDQDMEKSTQLIPVPAPGQPNISAAQISAATAQAKKSISLFAILISKLITDVGMLTIDCEVNQGCLCGIDDLIPGHISLIPKTVLIKGKDKGKSVTHKIIFTDKHMGKKYTPKQIQDKEWALYDKTGKTPTERKNSDQRTYEVNPYQYARTVYSCGIDVDEMMDKSIGAKQSRALMSFNILTDPRVAPYTDQQMVVDDFAIEEFGGNDPDRYKVKGKPQIPGQQGDAMANSIMNQNPTPQNFKLGGGNVVPQNAVMPH